MQLALGDQPGHIDMHVNSHSHSSSVLPLAHHHRQAFPTATELNSESVPVVTLDSISSKLDINPPCLLKIDVQGYEAKVIAGGKQLLKDIDFAVIETSFRTLYQGEMLFPELLDLMQQHGFRFLRPVGWLSNPKNGEILQMDALFEHSIKPGSSKKDAA